MEVGSNKCIRQYSLTNMLLRTTGFQASKKTDKHLDKEKIGTILSEEPSNHQYQKLPKNSG